jgi:hypothetical protein
MSKHHFSMRAERVEALARELPPREAAEALEHARALRAKADAEQQRALREHPDSPDAQSPRARLLAGEAREERANRPFPFTK